MTIDYPVIASNYFDDDRIGILDRSNQIIVGASSRLTKESAEFLCSRINAHAKLVAALKAVLEATPQEQCDANCNIENCPWMQAGAALREAGEL